MLSAIACDPQHLYGTCTDCEKCRHPRPIFPQSTIQPLPDGTTNTIPSTQPEQQVIPTFPEQLQIPIQGRQPYVNPRQPYYPNPIDTQPPNPFQPGPNQPPPGGAGNPGNQPSPFPIPTPGDGGQGIFNWLFFGGSQDFIISEFGSVGAVLGILAPVDVAVPPLAIITLAATAISFAILGIIDLFAGRPRLEATADIAAYANSPSPILAVLGKAAANAVALGIPISTSNSSVWGSLFLNAVSTARDDLTALYPEMTPQQISILMYILLQEMANPNRYSPVFLTQLLIRELKRGDIKIPTKQGVAPQAKIIGKMQLTRHRNARRFTTTTR